MISKDWADYRLDAMELQARLHEVEHKIDVYWTAALNAADGDKRSAWYNTPISKEDTPEGYEFMNLKGERVLLLQKIQAATAMSMMLYQQRMHSGLRGSS